MTFEFGRVLLTLHFCLIQSQYFQKLKKKLHAPNHKFYEQYYVDQAMQKGRNLPAFHGARFQRCYGLDSIFKGLFRWVMPHLQQGAKMIGKKGFTNGCQCCPRYS